VVSIAAGLGGRLGVDAGDPTVGRGFVLALVEFDERLLAAVLAAWAIAVGIARVTTRAITDLLDALAAAACSAGPEGSTIGARHAADADVLRAAAISRLLCRVVGVVLFAFALVENAVEVIGPLSIAAICCRDFCVAFELGAGEVFLVIVAVFAFADGGADLLLRGAALQEPEGAQQEERIQLL
jgi:hypothetical protein